MTAFTWYDCQWPWAYFKVIGLFHIKFLKNGVWYGKSYYRLLIGNHTLALDWCHFWWPWSTFEGHFSLGCHFYVHFSNPWHAFASHGLPAIAELLVFVLCLSSLLSQLCRLLTLFARFVVNQVKCRTLVNRTVKHSECTNRPLLVLTDVKQSRNCWCVSMHPQVTWCTSSKMHLG